jgi:hypothetical protein
MSQDSIRPDVERSSVDPGSNGDTVRMALRGGRSVALVPCAYMEAGMIACRYAGRAPCPRCRQLARTESEER